MSARDFDYGVSLALLLAATVAVASGLAADALDINEFWPHRYASYLTAGLAGLHVYLHWSRLTGWLRRKLAPAGKAEPEPVPPTRPTLPRTGTTGERASPPGLGRRGFLLSAATAVGGFIVGRVTAPPAPAILEYGSDVGQVYHEWSKPTVLKLLGTVADWGRQPEQYKEYAWAEKVALPPPGEFRGLPVEEAIGRRRSIRDYSGQPLSVEELSRLLFCASGITEDRWGLKLRAAPSAGALYPIELYPVVHNVSDLAPGLYHYSVLDHSLELLRKGDFRATVAQAGLAQEFLGQANVVLVLSAIFQRTRWKYRERTYRYVMLEAGHIGQNVYLAATSMGLGACAVGAFFDDDLNRLLGLDGRHEAVIYLLAVGKR